MDKPTLDIHSLKMNKDSIMIHVSVLGPALKSRIFQKCSSTDFWHKFVIGNVETYDRNFILKTIVDFVYPSELFPISFVKKKRAFFVARNCSDAIMKIMANKLVIPNPLHPNKPLRVVIIANHLPTNFINIDLSENITSVLKKRYYQQAKSLDLCAFHTEPDLKEFGMLSQPKLLLYVMQFVTEMTPVPIKIYLRDNFIKKIDPLHTLAPHAIRMLDLRNNELAKMEDLKPLADLKNVEILKLDGNPLCNLYNSYEYIAGIKMICPSIQMIDGISVFHPNGFLITQKNFLCNVAGGDLVEQFVHYYFTVYDYEDRSKIIHLYHQNAIFSLTSRIVLAQNTTKTAKLNHYLNISRNLHLPAHNFNHISKIKHLYKGPQNIQKILCELPRTFHDPLQFQCDLIYYTVKQAVLVVHGTFRENTSHLSFTRTFVLQRDSDNAYSITNEQLHVYNALDCQSKTIHKYPVNVTATCNPVPYYNAQFIELQKAVHEITSLNYDYSRRFLEACNFDIKSVITNFLELFTKELIPPEAFIETEDGPLELPSDDSNLPFPRNIKTKTKQQYGVVNPSTVWQFLYEQRLNTALKKKSAAEILTSLQGDSAGVPPLSPSKITFDMPTEEITTVPSSHTTAPSIVTVTTSQPGTSQEGKNVTASSLAGNQTTWSSAPVTAVIKKLNKFKQQRKLALKKKKAALKKNALKQEQNPNQSLQLNTPQQLGIGKDKETPQTLGIGKDKTPQTLGIGIDKKTSQELGIDAANPGSAASRNKGRKNRRRQNNLRGAYNINIIKQQYYFAP